MSPKTSLNRSKSGLHALKPAMLSTEAILDRPGHESQLYSRIRWTFGRGSVIRSIWKSVILHTLFAAVVVTLTMTTSFELAIPAVMLTVLGVVLGFVISYRAASGYDRYWMGRIAWSDVMKNCHTMARLIVYHVPPCRTPRTTEERATGEWRRPERELLEVMAEKKMALDLIEGFSVVLKHHLRGEPGLYYEDLYDLIRPLQPQTHDSDCSFTPFTTIENLSALSLSISPSQHTLHDESTHTTLNHPIVSVTAASPSSPTPDHTTSGHEDGRCSDIDSDYEVDEMGADHQGPWKTVSHVTLRGPSKYRPNVASDGDNLPLEILRCLSEWCSVLEDRGTVPGTSLGSIMNCISSFENNLSVTEQILTVPLPFVYSAHIRTVWLFLVFLPFQLVGMFGWHSIGGVLIASFIYLGFLAAGEEIEQPFGYDDNDLDLDLFCRAIIHVDNQQLQQVSCLNSYMSPRQKAKMKHHSGTVSEAVVIH